MWTGIHHIALVTRDLNATVAFYGEILGMEIGEILQRGVKHCFIKPGGDTWGMHFFGHPDAAIFTAPDLLTDRFIFLDGALQHIAFSLPDEQSAQMLRLIPWGKSAIFYSLIIIGFCWKRHGLEQIVNIVRLKIIYTHKRRKTKHYAEAIHSHTFIDGIGCL